MDAASDEGTEEEQIFATGELIDGAYEIIQLLGHGGMGQVFEALDHSLNRRVAIKAAWPNPLAPPLRNEARALAAFSHPSLVMVHSLGAHGDIDYLVMERVYGVPLTEHLATRPGRVLDHHAAVEILLPVAEGLAVVHRAGLVHRDVKPDNVMLTPDGRVVLMDFGLVLPEFHIDGQTTVAGSPPYMAPEALANKTNSGEGHLVDMFALGVVAYELLTGARPYDGATLREVTAAHKAGRPKLLSELTDCPSDLGDLIHEMIAIDPHERPQSAEGAARRLRGVRDPVATGDTLRPAPRVPNVLIVDDDADLARILSFYVRQILGEIEVRTASDGEQALRQVLEKEPDVMLLDLHMPRMNGIELCMQLRGQRLAGDCTIISVSAGAQEDDVQLLHQLGIHHFIEKGSNLRGRLRTVLSELFGSAVVND